ncbi:hypothetical protein Clacol_002731 [Clathrus columnatus]|uniref:Uncharacterized protein n=1 Tax=Clathrus columnatus TaxID=1419009 RepID=A0AAV5A5N0_9AGAM|nr:hypothetical protein Clacol_002731 [Clathrus columnatus]
MSIAEDDMDWQSSTQYHYQGYACIANLTFDVFLELVKRLEVWDVLNLRLVWIILAETITRRRPLPLPSFRSRDSLSLTELETAVCEAARLERNWLSNYARLRRPPKLLHEPNRRLGDPVVLLPGGRFIVTGAASGRGGGGTGGVIRVWDLSDNALVGSFEVRPEDTVLQWRPVDEGRAVMFMIRDGILTNDEERHYHLLRLDFSDHEGIGQAKFSHHSSLMQELPVADSSISEDVVLVLGQDIDETITIFVLQWRNGTMVSAKTDIRCPEHPYFAILSLNYVSIWVDSPSSPQTYSYPLSEIYPHLSHPPSQSIYLRNPQISVLSHVANINPSPPSEFEPLYRDTSRMWTTGPSDRLLARPLSIVHVAVRREESNGLLYTSLSHEYVPTQFTSRPSNRTYFAPLAILSQTVDEDADIAPIEYPVIAAESANIIFPENIPFGQPRLRVITIPPDDPAERNRDPQWYNDNLIRTMEIPPELDLTKVVQISLDNAAGILGVIMDEDPAYPQWSTAVDRATPTSEMNIAEGG